MASVFDEPAQAQARKPSRRRRVTREEMLDIAKRHVIEKGWAATRVQEIAADAGISRPTLYKEFSSKKELGDALALLETQRFMADLLAAAGKWPDDPHRTIRIGVSFVLAEGERPFLLSILREQRQGLHGILDLTRAPLAILPILIGAIDGILVDLVPESDAPARRFVAETIVRATLSFLINPSAEMARQDIARKMADLCGAYLGFEARD